MCFLRHLDGASAFTTLEQAMPHLDRSKIFIVTKLGIDDQPDEQNLSVILELMTRGGAKTIMAQRFIPEISAGDKRILVIDGEPIPYALARIPSAGETRGNLAAGGRGVGIPLSDKDRAIVETVAPRLREHGIVFAGLDVIGDFLTEVNVTSPTCIRELDKDFGLNIAALLFDAAEDLLK